MLSVNGVSIGSANYLPRIQPSENRLELADTLSWSFGKHSVKLGANVSRTEDYTNQLLNIAGSYTYANANDFALDFSENPAGLRRYRSYQQGFGNPAVNATILDTAFFMQDQHRASSTLTLNYGLRYEHSFLPKPPLRNPAYPQTGSIHSSTMDFGPRVGLSWNMGAHTVVRSGYGIYFGRYPGAFVNTMFTVNGVYQTQSIVQPRSTTDSTGPIFPQTLSQPPAARGTLQIGFSSPDLRTPYTEQADLAIERSLGRNVVVTANYIWSRGLQFFVVRDLNVGAPGTPMTFTINDAGGNAAAYYATPVYLLASRVDPGFSRILYVENGGKSWYNALALQLQRRFDKGFQAGVSYTWAHTIDTSLGNAGDNLFFGNLPPSTVFNGDYNREKDSSNLDQRHRLTVSWVWQPKLTSRQDVLSKVLVDNWQLSAITTLASGLPATETISVSASVPGVAYTGSINGSGGSSRVPFKARSTLRLDNIYRTDARLQKSVAVTESSSLILAFEVFNVTNKIANTSITTRAFTASGPLINPAPGLGSGTASAGFPDGTNARRAQVSVRLRF